MKMCEKVLDEENWRNEAQAVINDIRNHVRSVEISKTLKSTDRHVYLNFTTLEGDSYCVELSASGFQIVGKAYDTVDISEGEYFETPYGLLCKISTDFYKSFGNELMSKLNALHEE